jgi:hypothetical protein
MLNALAGLSLLFVGVTLLIVGVVILLVRRRLRGDRRGQRPLSLPAKEE